MEINCEYLSRRIQHGKWWPANLPMQLKNEQKSDFIISDLNVSNLISLNNYPRPFTILISLN